MSSLSPDRRVNPIVKYAHGEVQPIAEHCMHRHVLPAAMKYYPSSGAAHFKQGL